MENLMTYDEVINYLHKEKRQHHLLLGNGFSIAYNKDIFSYKALSKFIMDGDDPQLKEVFNIFNTQNFESIMLQLNNFVAISKVLDIPNVYREKISAISERLKNKLIDAISTMHPDYVFEVSDEESKACANFLSEYINNGGQIFSTNYDLLLYWVLLRNQIEKFIDGFGREIPIINSNKQGIEKKLIWGKYRIGQNVHYLHGSLLLFDNGYDITKVEYNKCEEKYIIDVIKENIINNSYPIFVAAGDENQKLNHIAHNKYLTFCYEKLCQVGGSLVVFGFSFSENDSHIIKAINKSAENNGLDVYVGIFDKEDRQHLISIENQFRPDILHYFDATTAHIWRQ